MSAKPVVVVSWDRNFGIGTIHSGKVTYCGLRLWAWSKPVEYDGKPYLFAIEETETTVEVDLKNPDQPKEGVVRVLKRKFIDARNQSEADRVFADEGVAWKAARIAVQKARLEALKKIKRPPHSPALLAAQLRVIGKNFKRTVILFRRVQQTTDEVERERLREELWQAFAEEAVIGFDGEPVFEAWKDAASFKRIAAGLEARRKRKHGSSRLGEALILGAMFDDFGSLPLRSIRDRLTTLHGFRETLTVDAVRNEWARLRLPSGRKRGRH